MGCGSQASSRTRAASWSGQQARDVVGEAAAAHVDDGLEPPEVGLEGVVVAAVGFDKLLAEGVAELMVLLIQHGGVVVDVEDFADEGVAVGVGGRWRAVPVARRLRLRRCRR